MDPVAKWGIYRWGMSHFQIPYQSDPQPLSTPRWLGFKYAFLSGLAEPAAVVLLGLVFPTNLDQVVVDCLLAAGERNVHERDKTTGPTSNDFYLEPLLLSNDRLTSTC